MIPEGFCIESNAKSHATRMQNHSETRVARDDYRAYFKDGNDAFRASRSDGVTLPKALPRGIDPRGAEGPENAARNFHGNRRGGFWNAQNFE